MSRERAGLDEALKNLAEENERCLERKRIAKMGRRVKITKAEYVSQKFFFLKCED